jgi:hypothetical protein
MKTITINIDDDVFRELKSAMIAKHLAQKAYGVVDQFLVKLIEASKRARASTISTFERMRAAKQGTAAGPGVRRPAERRPAGGCGEVPRASTLPTRAELTAPQPD